MSNPKSEKSTTSLTGCFGPALIVGAILLLYALSVAPVMKFTGNQASQPLQFFYAPLEYLYFHIPAVAQFYDWYFKLWGIDS